MSDLFALDPGGQASKLQNAQANPYTFGDDPPPVFQNFASGTGKLIMRADAAAVRGAAVIATAPLAYFENVTDQQGRFTDPLYKAIDDHIGSAVDYWTPDAKTTGTAAKITGGLVGGLQTLAVAGGNPALMLAAGAGETGVDQVNQGVDATTATESAALQTVFNAAGFKIPFLGSTLASRTITGAVGNALFGAANAEAQRKLLQSGGYNRLAQDFNPGDLSGRLVDLATGAVFGGVEHFSHSVTPTQRDALLASSNAQHFQVDAAPGDPVDFGSSIAHQAAMEQATQAILAGDPVTAPESITAATFAHRPEAPPAQLPLDLYALDANRAASGAPALKLDIPVASNLSEAERPIESAFRQEVGSDPDAAAAAYAKLKDAKGGKVLNTDTARELSPDYLKKRSLSAAVHEPASALVKYMFAKKLAEAPGPGEEPLVLFTAGGTGAGKSTAVKGALGPLSDRAQIVYDTNMENAPKAIAKIDQALQAGKSARVVYVYRDPAEALRLGALTRAMHQEAEHGSGRTVPIDTHIDTHVGSNAAIHEIAAHYENDPRVKITIIDNSGPQGSAHEIKLADLPKIDYNSTRERAKQVLESEHSSGRISDVVYRGFAGEASASNGQPGPADSGAGGQSEPQRAGQRPDQLSEPKAERNPTLDAARQVALANPDLRVSTGTIGPDGFPANASASEILANADAAVVKAQNDAKGFEAAISCYLQQGDE